jgi:hypothetical protein
LGRGFLACFAVWTIFAVTASAQIEVVTLHLSKVHGSVTDKSGGPITNAEVGLVLVSDGSTSRTIQTDSSGKFRIDCDPGSYWLRVKASGFSTASLRVIVGSDLQTLFQRKTLYVMLGPGACMDQCSWVYTSKREFDQAVRLNTGHYY